MLTISNGLDS